MHVRILIGASAYACINDGARKTDLLLSPGKGAQASLRESAAEYREKAARQIALAELAERAAEWLDANRA